MNKTKLLIAQVILMMTALVRSANIHQGIRKSSNGWMGFRL
ncbi:hypothetical protein ENHAE0001_0627 [Enhydrobacter aerosaccus SK60]|nr:hypothetical protein ENHAE0001_0627 [Enhydrobacter aerosaccus SK60]